MFLLTSSLELCRLNRSFTQNCIYPIFEKLKFHICFLDAISFKIAPSVALLFHLLLCSVFKVQVEEYTLKIEQCKNQSYPAFAALQLLNELGVALRAPQ